MSLFTNPVTFVVNTVDRIFNFRFSRQEGTSVVGEYFEPAAPLAQQDILLVKQDLGSKTKDRTLVSYRGKRLLSDGVTYGDVIANTTYVFHKEHTAAQRDEIMELMAVATGTEAYRSGISQRLV